MLTGATGQLGRCVAETLLTYVPATQVGLSVRDPEKARDFEQRGVRVVRADFTGPSSLAEAFDGAEQVLIISGTTLGEEGVRQHGNAIQAAKDGGVKRILYTSHQAANPGANSGPKNLPP